MAGRSNHLRCNQDVRRQRRQSTNRYRRQVASAGQMAHFTVVATEVAPRRIFRCSSGMFVAVRRRRRFGVLDQLPLRRMAAERHYRCGCRLQGQPQGNEDQQEALETAHGDKY